MRSIGEILEVSEFVIECLVCNRLKNDYNTLYMYLKIII